MESLNTGNQSSHQPNLPPPGVQEQRLASDCAPQKRWNREQPRIEAAFEVELDHPLTGRQVLAARDVNEEGVYLWFPQAPFKIGSMLKITLRHAPLIESRPSPRVNVRVSRIDDTGIVATFPNKSSAHLWLSANRRVKELQVGTDLFRVYLAAVVRDANHRVLNVQQNGRWLFPGVFLQAGHDWNQYLQNYLQQSLNLTGTDFVRTVLTYTDPTVVARESSTMSVFQLYTLPSGSLPSGSLPSDSSKVQLGKDASYSKVRWVSSQRQLDELSFSAEPLRQIVSDLLTSDG